MRSSLQLVDCDQSLHSKIKIENIMSMSILEYPVVTRNLKLLAVPTHFTILVMDVMAIPMEVSAMVFNPW